VHAATVKSGLARATRPGESERSRKIAEREMSRTPLTRAPQARAAKTAIQMRGPSWCHAFAPMVREQCVMTTDTRKLNRPAANWQHDRTAEKAATYWTPVAVKPAPPASASDAGGDSLGDGAGVDGSAGARRARRPTDSPQAEERTDRAPIRARSYRASVRAASSNGKHTTGHGAPMGEQ